MQPTRKLGPLVHLKSPLAVIPPHPLDHPGTVKILLSKTAGEALEAAGEFFLILASRADCTAPQEVRGRFVLICQPVDKETADNAAAVALGRKKAIAIRKYKGTPPGEGKTIKQNFATPCH